MGKGMGKDDLEKSETHINKMLKYEQKDKDNGWLNSIWL